MSPCCDAPVRFHSEYQDRDPETGYQEYTRLWKCERCGEIWYEDEVERNDVGTDDRAGARPAAGA